MLISIHTHTLSTYLCVYLPRQPILFAWRAVLTVIILLQLRTVASVTQLQRCSLCVVIAATADVCVSATLMVSHTTDESVKNITVPIE